MSNGMGKQQEVVEILQKKAESMDVDPTEAMNQVVHVEQAMSSLAQLDFDLRDETVELMQAVANVKGYDDREDVITDETLEKNIDACFEALQKIRENEHTDDNLGTGKQ